MKSVAFTNWQRDGHGFLNTSIFKTEGHNNRWGRLLCIWQENGKGAPQNHKHHVCYCIDLYNGDVYLEDSKKVIFGKMLGSIAVRVSQVFQKTLFHLLLPISLPIIVAFTVKQEVELNAKLKSKGQLKEMHSPSQIGRKCLRNCAKSMMDIVKTPLYGLAMMVSSLFALVIAPFDPSQLYDMRKLIGEFEDKLCENDVLGWWKFTPCFHPFTSIDKIHRHVRQKQPDTDYAACKNQFEINLTNMARSTVLFYRRRENMDAFNCYSTHPYNSADYLSIQRKAAKA